MNENSITTKCFAILLALFSSLAFAQEQEEETAQQRRATLAELEQSLYKLESELDAFDPAIGEVAFDIAERQRENGLYEDALVSYRRHIYLLRINEGLETEKQIPALEKIVLTNYESGNLEKAGESLVHLYRTYNDNIGFINYSIEQLLEKGNWHLSLLEKSLDQYKTYHLFLAYSCYHSATELKLMEEKGYEPDLFITLNAINYAIADLSKVDNDLLASSQGLMAYTRGIQDLKRALYYAEQSEDPKYRIQALMQLGDWQKVFKKHRESREYYLEAYDYTQELAQEHPMRNLFDAPQEAQDYSFLYDRNSGENVSYHDVAMSFNVSRWGGASGSKVVELNLPNEELDNRKIRRAAVRLSNKTNYRPRIIDRELVATKDVERTITVAVQ